MTDRERFEAWFRNWRFNYKIADERAFDIWQAAVVDERRQGLKSEFRQMLQPLPASAPPSGPAADAAVAGDGHPHEWQWECRRICVHCGLIEDV